MSNPCLHIFQMANTMHSNFDQTKHFSALRSYSKRLLSGERLWLTPYAANSRPLSISLRSNDTRAHFRTASTQKKRYTRNNTKHITPNIYTPTQYQHFHGIPRSWNDYFHIHGIEFLFLRSKLTAYGVNAIFEHRITFRSSVSSARKEKI